MALTVGDRQAVCIEMQRRWSTLGLPCGVTKAQLQVIVNTIDDWCDTNQASLISAINAQPGGTNLNATMKGWLFDFVVRKRIADL